MVEHAVTRTDVSFASHGVTCRGWLYRPARPTRSAPGVVMSHGFSLTRRDGLAFYADALAAAGAAVLVYDHRYLGESDGAPRQLTALSGQLEDRRSAVRYLRGLAGVDRDRIVLWGYSQSGITAQKLAITDGGFAGIILMCTMFDCFPRTIAELRAGPASVAWAFRQVAKDLLGRRTMIAATAPPGEHGMLTGPGEAAGFAAARGPDSLWRNEVCARSIATIPLQRPLRKAAKIACPVLVQQGTRDFTVDAKPMSTFVGRAPNAELRRYDADHFQPLYDDVRRQIAADQADWLTAHIL
jgi:fermentation-respiration switch protein FrsA (DUF1100 family)